jgi:phosphoglycolate phosphatase
MVGDSPFDVETARRGGIDGFFVTTGTHSAGELQAAGTENVYPDLLALARDAFGIVVDPA